MGGWGTEKQDAKDNWERLKEHAEATVGIRERACLAASWLESLSHFLSLDGCVAFSSITGGMIFIHGELANG